NGWVPFSTQNPAVLISPTPQMTFLENKWYSIRLYGRNTCSPTDKMDLFVVRVPFSANCTFISTFAPCNADFELTSVVGGGSLATQAINKSEANILTMSTAWDFGDGNIRFGGSSPEHTYTRGGTYNVTLTVEDESGCKDVATKSITVRGRNEFGASRSASGVSDKVKLVPNPANRHLEVQYESENASYFKLYTLDGRELQVVELDSTSPSTTVDTQDVPQGMYIGKIYDNGILISSHKILITH
ncbi:MAG: PKD domain-containing protein, partial [Rhodothermales bacterium]